MRLLRAFVAALVLFFAAGGAFAQSPGAAEKDAPRNVVFMVSDGAGPAVFTMARDVKRYRQGGEGRLAGQAVRLALDPLLLGSLQTYSADSRVTDSAAGATAFSTGHKTNNGAIAVDPQGRPLATLLEAAQQRGMATGLVVTSRITHATPAAFAAHVEKRGAENEIARQLLAHRVDVLLGGGRRHFQTEAAGGERTDGRDLMAEARKAGYTVVTDRAGFEQAEALPVLGLFAESHLPFVIDRRPGKNEAPTLEAMTQKALRLLSESKKGRANGFFLLVEGSRIDHAEHNDDAAAALHETLAYDRTAARVRAFAERDGQTLLLSTSDHETGGLSLGRKVDGKSIYGWKPSVLEAVDASQHAMVEQAIDGGTRPAQVLEEDTGVAHLSKTERDRLNHAAEAEQYKALDFALSDVIGRRAIIGWTSGGHTAVDVNLYGFGPGAGRFAGHHDNTYVGTEVADLMGFDLDGLTAQLRRARERNGAATGSE